METMNFQLPYSEKHYSQSDEDGIILHMVKALTSPNNKCVEIGWGCDKKSPLPVAINCTQNLVQNHNYQCTAFDMRKQGAIPMNVDFHRMRVTPDSCQDIFKLFDNNVDVFSLDIDSYDYEVMTKLISLGFRPSVICAEINRQFGYEQVGSFPYIDGCKNYTKQIWHGVSYKKYRNFFESIGYKFFTLSSNSVNVFFYDPTRVDESLLSEDRLDSNKRYGKLLESFKQKIGDDPFWKNYVNEIMQ